MTKPKETLLELPYTTKQNKFYNENGESISNKKAKAINGFDFENEEHVRFNANLQKLKKPNKSVQVNFNNNNNQQIRPKTEKPQEKATPKIEEDSTSEYYQLKIPQKSPKKQINKSETKTNDKTNLNETEIKPTEKTNLNKTEKETNFNKKEKNKQYKSDRQKRKSTYDPSIFLSSPLEPSRRFKFIDNHPIKLVVTLKDIGLEGLDSYEPSNLSKPQENKPQATTAKKEIKETGDKEKKDEETMMKKVQEAWEKRKEMEKNTNTYDPKIFYDPSFSPTKKIRPEDMPPIKLNVELKDIGLDGLDSYNQKSTKEVKIQTPLKNEVKDKESIKKYDEEERMKKIQEDFELRKEMKKKMNTYDPKIFQAPPFSPTKINPEDFPPIKLNVELKDIGLEGLDSFKQEKQQEVKPRNLPKKEVKNEKKDEETMMKKVQEAWEKRKEMEKNTNTYDPKIFYDPSFSPTKKIKPEDIPPVKLNVELKDIGLDGLDSYNQKSTKEVKIQTPLKNEVKDKESIKKYDEEERMKQIQKDFELRKEMEKKMNTYDPKIFQAPPFSPTKIIPGDLPPIKLNVELKDIGLEGLDSFVSESPTKSKSISQQKSEIHQETNKDENQETNDKKANFVIQQPAETATHSNFRTKRRRKEENSQQTNSTSTYDPNIFKTDVFESSKRKIKPKKNRPIKLNVTLKDIGLEGLDSYTTDNSKFQCFKPKSPEKVEPFDQKDVEIFRITDAQNITSSNVRFQKPKYKNPRRKSTYDPSIFYTSSCSSFRSAQLTAGKIKPIKLKVTLKDINLEGLDSF